MLVTGWGICTPSQNLNVCIWCGVETINISLADIQISDQARDTENLSCSGTIFDTDMKFRPVADVNI